MTVQASGIHIHQSYLMSKACQSCFPPALSDNQVETSMRRDSLIPLKIGESSPASFGNHSEALWLS